MTLIAQTTTQTEQASCTQRQLGGFVSETTDRVTQLLRDAATHILARGLWQGAYYSSEAGTNGPASLVGALHIAAGHQPQPPLTFAYGHGMWPVEPDFETALELITEVLGELWPTHRSHWDHLEDIENWQDTRTGLEVLEVLDAAANLAAARHSGTIR